ncbi:heterogeneous nuclear ribonucleoprotein A/B/D [Pancytospora philotis]|nr:heterogeneous nuclear ribonucleoprotein A/B/D [Pancytospora philotis]
MARKPVASTNKKVAKKDESESETESSASAVASESSVAESSSTIANSEAVEAAGGMIEEVDVSSTESEEGSAAEKAVGDAESSSVSEETQSGSADEAGLDEETMRTIFIKELDYDTTESEIRQEMEKIGPIGRVHVPMTHDTRRNKGFAYVEFLKLADAKKALKLNGTTLLGRTVVVDQARPKTNFCLYTVFCKNLSFDTTKPELLEHFNKFGGKVHNLSLPLDTENEGRNRGFCFVEYTNEELANKVANEKHIINNRKLYCNMGNKNEDRNNQRRNDRLYGRRDGGDDRRGGNDYRRGGDDRRGGNDYRRGGDDNRRGGEFRRSDNYGGRSNNGNRKVFNDDE